jgi:hypothetical protein
MVEMCCLSETLTGVFFTEMHARATNPMARTVVESLLEDEIDHGRVGWAYLAARTQQSTLSGLASALPSMLDRTFGTAIRNLGRVTDDDAMEAFGYVRDEACGEIFRRALRDVVIPGFEMLGVDLVALAHTPSEARRGCPRRGEDVEAGWGATSFREQATCVCP